MGFWSEVFRSINPFAKEDLSSPQAREKKAWRAASSMYWLQYVRPFEKHELQIARQEAQKRARIDKTHAQSWSKKLFYLNKFAHRFDQEERRAYRESSGLPRDIHDRAQYVVIHEQGQLSQQRPSRHFEPFKWSTG